MGTFEAYYLSFRSPLRVGERGVGLEAARTYVSADTLFSALCSTWRLLYGETSLLDDFLRWFPDWGHEAVGAEGEEPLFLSSAFPMAGDVRFFPRPLPRLNVIVEEDHEKAFKRVRFVSQGVFEKMINGGQLRFREEDCVNGRTTWTTGEERARLSDWTDDSTGDIALWKTAVVPRVALDRVTSASEIWHLGEVTFARGCGLWFAVWFNPQHSDVQRKFEAALRLLGDEGLGGERSAGKGAFQVAGCQVNLPDTPNASHFITLAPLCPKDPVQMASLTTDGAAYQLLPKRGWVGSPEGGNLRRKTIWVFGEGSLLAGACQPPPGRLADLTPDVLKAHRVFRYAYAFPVGVNT